MSGRRNCAPWFQVQRTSSSAKYLSAQVSHLVAAACLDNFSTTKLSPKCYPRHDICFSLLLEVWCKEQARWGGTWLSGFGILRSKGGHQGVAYFSVPSDSGQHTESGVFYFCVHTRLHSWCLWQDLCGGESWAAAGWVMWPSPGANKACSCFSPLFTFHASLGKGRRMLGGGCCGFEEKPVKKNSPYVWHSLAASWGWLGGGPSTPYQAIPLPHGDDEAVTTGRCHFPRIFFFFWKKAVVWHPSWHLATKGTWWMSRFILNVWYTMPLKASFVFLGICSACSGEAVK